mgnify:CR=1 FL=1
MLKTKFSISVCCALTLFFILFCFNGIEIFSNHLIWVGVIAYSFIMFENFESFVTKIITEKDNEKIDSMCLLKEELNHENIKIRKYYRNKINYSEYFGAYLIALFFPLFIIILPLQKTKFGESFYDLFFDNPIIECFFKIKAKKVIDKKEVIENHKPYTVETYLDGRIVYKYKNKIHREKGAASFYPKKYFTFSNYRNKYFIHGKQVSIDQFEKSKIQYNCENF